VKSFRAGDRVVHPKCPDWGVGEVIQGGQPGPKVKALFARGGLRTVLADHLELAPPAEKPRTGRPPW
jgi:hypothetical protein